MPIITRKATSTIINKESLTTKRNLIFIGLTAVCVSYILFLAILAPQQLAEAAVTATNVMCNGCVGSSDIGNGQVRSVDIGDGTVRAVDIANPAFMKRITLLDGAPGWNPNGATTTFLINDNAADADNAIIIVNTQDFGTNPICAVDNLENDEFFVKCHIAPLNGARLNYAIIQIPSTAIID